MSSAKSKFEITRNRSCNNIKENLECSSNILKNYKHLLASEAQVNTNQKNYHSDVEKRENAISFGKYYNPYIPDDYISKTKLNNYSESGIYGISGNNEKVSINKFQENDVQKEFSNTMFYDKIMRNHKSYNTAIHNIQNNFQTNKLKTVLNSIKFEDSANITIPPYIKKSPLYILYPELQNRVHSDNIIKYKSEEKKKEVSDNNSGIIADGNLKCDIKDDDKNEKNGEEKTSLSKDPVIGIKEKLIFDVEERKSIHNYLKNNLNNNNIIRNKMMDYFESEKNVNMIEIGNPNNANLINVHEKNNKFENAILNSYKNIHVSNNMNSKTENELKTLKILKEQKMLIINKNEKGENIIINQDDMRDKSQRRRINLLKDFTTKGLLNHENKTGIISNDKGVAQISIIDTSNKKAVLKTFRIKNNKEIMNDEDEKKKKSIFKFIKKKKNVKDVQVQTNKDDFENQNKKNDSDNVDSDVERIIDIFNKKGLLKKKVNKYEEDQKENNENNNTNKLKSVTKEDSMNNLEKRNINCQMCKDSSTSNDKFKNNNKIDSQKIIYNISYKNTNESNNSNTSTDDSDRNSQTCSENDSANFSNESHNKNVQKDREEKKIDMIQNIINYKKSLKLGISYNSINEIPNWTNRKGTNHVNNNFFKIIKKFEKGSHSLPYLQKNVIFKYKNSMGNGDIGKEYYEKNASKFINHLSKNEKIKQSYPFSIMKEKIPIIFKPINKSVILKNNIFNLGNSDNHILGKKNINNKQLSNHINSPNKHKEKEDKSKIINNLLLNKLYIYKKIKLEKEKSFKNTFTSLLKNKNIIKYKIQNSLHELKNMQYGGYTSNDSSDSDNLFRINKFVNKKCDLKFYNKKSKKNISTFSDFNVSINNLQKENNLHYENNVHDYLKNKKHTSNKILSFNNINRNKLKKKSIEQLDSNLSIVHTECSTSDEFCSTLKKEKQRMERFRSISYKNRLNKLLILKKNIHQFKENGKNIAISESVHNEFENEKERNDKVYNLKCSSSEKKTKKNAENAKNESEEKIELRKNDDDNKLRIKVNLKSVISKDENENEKYFKCATHEKAKMHNPFEKEKINTTNYTDTEMEIRKKKSRELFPPKIYNRPYLKKKDGSGGGNYLKIKPPSLNNAKNVEINKKKKEAKKELIAIDKHAETNKNGKNYKHDGSCQLVSLEQIDPNNWVQRIFGDV
ncbi:conserved Plasmodium protein, unknown function [Plasmodium berghei]|uniref:Uncharacterized protein n=2 Tax=Plasmodium berghei TaxID=5821 RepID=A0A509ALY1_PLABA|nr:conserved Plasmodium protein, unknown function [Plasmodium berghei ANKA]CXI44332.1 conserved Plasmodium protein, unknown function [Plasmodium berghei]SCM22491.1 conserved Plasmodium protein, unknown function [Plasmodium berghei]SCN25480.1 conserved Plasmodium protein, unknown function [Plasmodium berghei]SCO60442.1 conserved Plasmodium protein, unknown function [Plasmodium berghei]SCO62237.1 conserved Plasmodium protein, unknown function [Plasmodium berghei]|eukprot:XP_034421651.1 conserved Plasmodium protein, unknown function [Plasmodium berghei ANKA]